MQLDFFPKLHRFTTALSMHSHLAWVCPSIDSNRLFFPSQVLLKSVAIGKHQGTRPAQTCPPTDPADTASSCWFHLVPPCELQTLCAHERDSYLKSKRATVSSEAKNIASVKLLKTGGIFTVSLCILFNIWNLVTIHHYLGNYCKAFFSVKLQQCFED